MKMLYLAAFAPMLLLAACGSADPAESVAAIRQTEQAQLESISSKDLVGIARLYTDDAQLVRPDGSVLDGGVAIVEEYGVLLEDPNFAISVEPVSGWASSDGELAVVTSNIQFTTTDPASGAAVSTPINSQTVWQRQSGATWKIISAYNVARPAAPTVQAAAEAAE